MPARPTLLAAPDAFKGTASAPALADAAVAAAHDCGWEASSCPLSDGGEGFADVVAAARAARGAAAGEGWRHTEVTGPLGDPVSARWWLAGGEAVLESAAASGLPLAGGAAGNDPLGATTRGTGELVVAAMGAGARRVLVGVGGSATTDGGRGALEAIEAAGGLGELEVVVACDVETQFVDAASRFGPQKGATPGQVEVLTERLTRWADELGRRYGVDVTDVAGSGAAGGLAGGLLAAGARLAPGFAVVSDAVDLPAQLRRADLVLTGEGCLDTTSWAGKVVGGVVRAASPLGVPVLVVVGAVGPGGLEGAVGLAPARIEVRSLTALVGEVRAMAEPATCLAEAVAEFLHAQPAGRR